MASSVASSSTARPTFFGLFDRPATPERDLEAQFAGPLTPPTPVLIHAPRAQRTSVDADATDAVDAFFGVSRPPPSRRTPSLSLAGTRDSRHDEQRQSTIAESESEVPPSYEDSLQPPAYTQVSDQPTLAMYLFKFGFLFPIFWLAGALILLSPLRAPEDWEMEKSAYEREELIESMRRTEIKWARRCLYALLVTFLVAAAVVLAVVFSARS
ncbi:hypothetical protein C8Q80DRAFT_1117698 [Daedaleopsis nitida]|nr:hypothetical protein C8Q80DRAFT_1117698 [Daedaleopsis nitida]